MRKFFSLVVLMFTVITGIEAQIANDVFYVFKSDWSPAKDLDHATYFMQVVHEDDTTYYCRYYQKTAPMVKQECYKDSNLTTPEGMFAWYNKKGWIDSTGLVKEGIKAGRWYTYGDTGKIQTEVYFENGKRTKTVDYRVNKELYADGTQKDIEDKKDTAKDTRVMVEAKYPGGEAAWTKFLIKNLQTPERFQNIIHDGSGNVVISFLVNKEGDPDELMLVKSCEWSADAEVFRIIKAGGKWAPATIDGRKVIYRQKQSITFQVRGGF